MTHRLFLHIGTHKTGTTTVQRFLAANREALRRQGLVYPDLSIGGLTGLPAHHRVAHAMAGRPGAGSEVDASTYFDALRTHLREGERAVVSAESLYRHVLPDLDGSDRQLDAGGGAVGDPLAYIQRVRKCVGDFDVTLLVMLRRQDLFIESLYAEQVMSSNYVAGIARFAEERTWLADYDARLEMWASVFGADALSVRVFEPQGFRHPIERDFVEWVGGRWDDSLRPAVVSNVTLPRALVEYKRALNGQPRAVSTTYRQWLEALAASSPEGRLPDLGRYYLAHDARQAFLGQFDEGNRRVARRYLGRSELFADGPFPAYDTPPPLRPRHFRRITRQLLRSLA